MTENDTLGIYPLTQKFRDLSLQALRELLHDLGLEDPWRTLHSKETQYIFLGKQNNQSEIDRMTFNHLHKRQETVRKNRTQIIKRRDYNMTPTRIANELTKQFKMTERDMLEAIRRDAHSNTRYYIVYRMSDIRQTVTSQTNTARRRSHFLLCT